MDCSTGRRKTSIHDALAELRFQNPRRPKWLELMGKIIVKKGPV